MHLVHERELPDQGPFDPPLEMKAGELWAFGNAEGGYTGRMFIPRDQVMTKVVRQVEERRTVQLLWPETPEEWPTASEMNIDFGAEDLDPPDSYQERFEVERTERCWRDNCLEHSDCNSETGLCIRHLTELRSRWAEARQ
jgi:hypothetical protein